MKNTFLILFLFLHAITNAQEHTFSQDALQETLMDSNGEELPFSAILERHQGKEMLLDFWATWCKDCITGLPDLKNLQGLHPDIVYVFLSLDKNLVSWKKGIEKYQLEGDHYFITSGWKGPLCSSIDLDWIPRYMLIAPDGTITVNRAITTKDNQLQNHIK